MNIWIRYLCQIHNRRNISISLQQRKTLIVQVRINEFVSHPFEVIQRHYRTFTHFDYAETLSLSLIHKSIVDRKRNARSWTGTRKRALPLLKTYFAIEHEILECYLRRIFLWLFHRSHRGKLAVLDIVLTFVCLNYSSIVTICR